MDLFNSRDKINICFILSLVSIFFYVTSGWALEPTITDVTTRSFSVVWTEDGTINDSGQYSLNIKNTNNELLKEFTTSGSVIGDANQVDISMESDADALARRVYKFEVIGLDIDMTYRCQGTKSNGSSALFSGGYEEVTTEKVKGLSSYADANDNDIVTNDILHLVVYNTDGITPALGALVMGEIYSDAECTEANRLSYKPITGFVGIGMPGILNDSDYLAGKYTDPNKLSYKEYGALNFNNLFGLDSYPLQLTGDDMSTSGVVEGEYAKIRVIPGMENGALKSEIEYKIPVPEITEVSGQKISSAKVTAEFKFNAGMNIFSYPCEVPKIVQDGSITWQYSTKDLFKTIEAANGDIEYILSYSGGWTKTYKKTSTLYKNPVNIEEGKAYIVMMNAPMANSFFISGYPSTTKLQLSPGMNLCGFPQIPTFYTTKNLFKSIEGVNANSIDYILTYDGGWTKTYKKTSTLYKNPVNMNLGMGHFVFQNALAPDVIPLSQ